MGSMTKLINYYCNSVAKTKVEIIQKSYITIAQWMKNA